MSEERHSRHKARNWGGMPSRSQQRAAAVGAGTAGPAKRAPGRKDRDRCKAARGGPHVPAVVLDKYAGAYGVTCEWSVPWLPREDDEPRWHCRHHEECANCGKTLRVSVEPGECPGYREPTDEERAAIAEALTRIRERYADRASRKPVISGPQGYRRKRES